MFKGLLPVNLPDNWFGANDKAIKFANINGSQAIDFRAVGGKALRFWTEHNGAQVSQCWEEIKDPESIEWGDRPFAIDSRKVVGTFGQSSKVLDLIHL